MAMLETLYTMLGVKQNNGLVKAANIVGFVRRKQKKKKKCYHPFSRVYFEILNLFLNIYCKKCQEQKYN